MGSYLSTGSTPGRTEHSIMRANAMGYGGKIIVRAVLVIDQPVPSAVPVDCRLLVVAH